ncbi:WYL domain-containing protein [Chitinispirillales bacterium ANBcel5]|uniref:helix-turn-helix transcriptional regulator n=1 Tax=Cellulosispirillum alkaliphilum TaxID=3039283 RepID=UPI002A54AABB|nr:WYL domain-containing protein [Chitinispirillales bacterium ANBcel5]
MAKWHKVVELHRLLSQSRSYLSKRELADTLNTSSATVDRLIRELRYEFGAPLKFEKRYNGYRYDISDDETFELPGLWFTTDELKALLCLEALVGTLQEGFLSETFCAFRARIARLLSSRDIDLADWKGRFKIVPIANRPTNPSLFTALTEAVLHRKKIDIRYLKLQGAIPEDRLVSPQAIIRYKDNWYVDAWCHKKEGLREFALNRILSVMPTEEPCKEICTDEMKAFYGNSYGIFTGPAQHVAEIRFSGIAAREVSQQLWHPKQEGFWEGDDETFTLKVPYGHSRELLMDALKWGADAEVLRPVELRDEIGSIVGRMSEKYEKVEMDIRN